MLSIEFEHKAAPWKKPMNAVSISVDPNLKQAFQLTTAAQQRIPVGRYNTPEGACMTVLQAIEAAQKVGCEIVVKEFGLDYHEGANYQLFHDPAEGQYVFQLAGENGQPAILFAESDIADAMRALQDFFRNPSLFISERLEEHPSFPGSMSL